MGLVEKLESFDRNYPWVKISVSLTIVFIIGWTFGYLLASSAPNECSITKVTYTCPERISETGDTTLDPSDTPDLYDENSTLSTGYEVNDSTTSSSQYNTTLFKNST